MDITKCINNRRSIRKFQDKQIETETITEILKAAMAAPSACNKQPWEFIVVTDSEIKADIQSVLPYGRYDAPVAIVICGNMERTLPNIEQNFWIQDCSAAIQNILLTATALNLGSCWIGVYPLEKRTKNLSELFELPNNLIPLGVVYIGHSDEEKEARTQYNENFVHYQKYTIK